MQRLLSMKLASNLPKTISTSTTNTTTVQSSSLFHFQPHKTFCLTKPPQNHLFSSIPTHPHLHQHKIHGFLSNPLLTKHISLDTLKRVLSKKLQYPKQSITSNPSRVPDKTPWRTLLRGLSSNNNVLWGLIIANVAVFLLWRVADPVFMTKHFFLSSDNFTSGRLHTLITPAFSHVNIGHMFSNMIGLFFFGRNIGRNFGPQYLLKLYLAGAVGGSVFYLVHQSFLASSSKGLLTVMTDASNKTLILGATSAVDAIILLHIFLYPTATIYLDFVIPVPAMLMGVYIIGRDLFMIMGGKSNSSGAGLLGGVAVATVVWARLRMGRGLL